MIKLFTEEEFHNAKANDVLPIECTHCHKTFYNEKKYIKHVITTNRKTYCQFCSKKCYRLFKTKEIHIPCYQCGKQTTKKQHEINESKHTFCSQSCAAICNNKLHPKRKLTNKCKCGKLIASGYTYCKDCITLGKHIHGERINNHSIDSLLKACNDTYYVNNQIHNRARLMKKNIKKCENCGYSHHVEVCHVKPIKEFSKDTLISDINKDDNLVVLCKNCHWDLDHGFLNKNDIKG